MPLSVSAPSRLAAPLQGRTTLFHAADGRTVCPRRSKQGHRLRPWTTPRRRSHRTCSSRASVGTRPSGTETRSRGQPRRTSSESERTGRSDWRSGSTVITLAHSSSSRSVRNFMRAGFGSFGSFAPRRSLLGARPCRWTASRTASYAAGARSTGWAISRSSSGRPSNDAIGSPTVTRGFTSR